MNRSLAIASAALFTCVASTTSAQELMPPHVIERLGLTQSWARPMNVPFGSQSIADQQLFVHEKDPQEFVEIVTGGAPAAPAAEPAPADPDATAEKADAQPTGKVLVRIPTDRIGPGGKPIGRAEAERLANNEIRRLKRRGIDASINVRTVPRVRLYTIGTNGALECRDAETGEPLWVVYVGDQRLPFLAIGTSEDYLTVINGGNLIQVETTTGEVIEEVQMSGAPLFGAINSGDFAMVPLIGGAIEGYPLYDPTRDPFMEIVAGGALAMPTKAPGSTRVGWGTDRGFVYVMELQGTPSVLFRLNTDGIVSGRLASATGNRYFFGSEAGQAYGLRATRIGQVLWSQPFGEPFYNEPLVIGEQVLIRSTYGNLFSLSVENGSMTWDKTVPNVAELIVAFDGRAYCTSLGGSLMVVDLESGEVVGTFSEVRPSQFLSNNLTDRLYLINTAGDVQCLRPEAATLPNFNVQPDVAPVEEEATKKPTPESTTSPFGPAAGDPFGGGAAGGDPFGGGGDPFGGGGNDAPMGDPFGGGGNDAGMDNPFGGNPFGG